MNLKSSSYLEIANIWKKLSPEWSEETKEFVNELFSRLEHAELDLQVLNLRLKNSGQKVQIFIHRMNLTMSVYCTIIVVSLMD